MGFRQCARTEAKGTLNPLIQTASGAVLTAGLDAQELARLEEEVADQPVKSRRLFEQNRAFARYQGYCECTSMVVEGVINISAPIHEHSGQVIAAVTIPFIRRLAGGSHVSRVQSRKALMQMSQDISCMLGGLAND